MPPADGESDAAWMARVADRLTNASAEELTSVFGVGQVVADSIALYFRDEHTGEVLRHLVEAGVTAERPEPGAAADEGTAGREDGGRDRHPSDLQPRGRRSGLRAAGERPLAR